MKDNDGNDKNDKIVQLFPTPGSPPDYKKELNHKPERTPDCKSIGLEFTSTWQPQLTIGPEKFLVTNKEAYRLLFDLSYWALQREAINGEKEKK